ncbi:MAG: hypothetical protein ACFFE4_09285 [Candidatus Thorarchaeota archaeon]
MKNSLPLVFKLISLVGFTLLFISFFVEWYSFQVFEDGILVSSWKFNLFFEWSTDLPQGIVLNENFRPESLNISPIIHVFFIITLIFSVYTIFFKDPERSENLISLKKFSFGFVSVIVLLLFYIFVIPVIYLIPNGFLFPSLHYINLDLSMRFSYFISYGYILQLIGFILIFPYSIHFYLIIFQFEKQENSPENQVNSYIKNRQEMIDFDKFIAEEEALL